MMRAWSEMLIDPPIVWDLGLRITALLVVAWSAHLMLVRCNPRWRVQLWRFTSMGILAVALTAFLPKVSVSIGQPERVADLGTETLPESFGSLGHGPAELGDLSNDNIWISTIGAEKPVVVREAPADENLQKSFAVWWSWSREWVLGVFWSIGAVVLAAWWVAAQMRIRALLSKSTPASERCHRLLRQASARLEMTESVKLRVSTETSVPFVAGWRHPTIVLPANMARPDSEHELPAIFAHELTHILSYDLVWMGVTQWIAIPLWFHPLTWRIRSAHSMACEEVADAVAADNVGDVASYSGTLARVALAAFGHPPTVAAISMARSPEILSRLARLKRGVFHSPLSRPWLALAAVFALLAFLPLASLKFAYAELSAAVAGETNAGAESLGEGDERVLEFPVDRSVGALSIATEKESEWWDRYAKRFDYRRDWDWKYLSLAQGKVKIPAGAKVKLQLQRDGVKEMSWVAKLNPDDLYELSIFPFPETPNVFTFGDAQIQHLSHLTGLTELTLQNVQVTDQGMRHLESMQALQKLSFYAAECGNGALKSIGQLSSLEVLDMGIMKWTDVGLLHLANLKSLQEISFPDRGRPGKGFDAIVQLPNLKYIGGHTFTDVHMARLKGSKTLRALNLDNNEFLTDAGLAHLADVPKLEYLNLHHTNITEGGVQHLRPLKSLKHINLMVNRKTKQPVFTVATAQVLSELPSLEDVGLQLVGGADEFLGKLSVLHNLQSLSLGGRKDTGFITNAGMKHVAKLNNLQRLILSGTNLSDEAGDSLAQLLKLTSLALDTSNLTDEGVAKLSALKKLQYLNLSANSRKNQILTFSGVSRLKELPELNELWYGARKPAPEEKGLDFSGFPKLAKVCIGDLRDVDLAGLSHCKNLQWLQCTDSLTISDAGLAHLAGLRSMERLALSGNGITDAGLVHLQAMNRLHDLTLHGNLTDGALRHIEKLNSLETLRLNTKAAFSPSAVSRLREKLPNLYGISINQDRTGTETKNESLTVGQMAPPFTATSLDGQEISIAGHRGKVLLLYFWSTSCAPCVASMPKTKESYEVLSKYKDFAMVSLSGDDNDPIVRNFVKQQKLTWPQVRIGEDSKIAAAYGITGFPSYVLIGRDGKILCTVASRLDAALREALAITDNKSN